jgi:hypothetical protein
LGSAKSYCIRKKINASVRLRSAVEVELEIGIVEGKTSGPEAEDNTYLQIPQLILAVFGAAQSLIDINMR